jgi:hypothetical protein
MGFEVVVRPAVFPNIRPASPHVLAPADNPDQGIAVIGGGGGKFVGTSYSWSVSVSRQKPHTETKRQFNKERVQQVDNKGNINPANFVDLERLKKVRLDADTGPYRIEFLDPPKADNVKTLETDVTR